MCMSRLLSRRCCGGPVLTLSLVFSLLGGLFLALAATGPGVVFILSGVGALILCMTLGRSRCRQDHGNGLGPRGC